MFNKDTNLIFEAYQHHTVNESKMKDIATAIEMGDDVDDIIKDLKLPDTEQIRTYITKERDDFYEKGERADQIDSEDMESCSEEGEPEDMESCSEEGEPEDGEYQGGMGTYNLSTMDDKGRLQVMKMRLEDLIKDGGTFEEFARTVAYQRDLIKQNSEMEEDPEDEKKEKERAGLAHSRAVADHYEDEPEEDAERCPVTGKLRKKSQDEEDEITKESVSYTTKYII